MSPAIRGHVSRDALPILSHLLDEEPAIMLEGPRGSGKSTLLREIAGARDATVVDLDDEAVVGFVQQDPTTALTHPGLVVVDEFQRVPAVLSVVKRIVDRSGEPGRFLLAGSVSSRLLPTGAETLTGRVHRMLLPPLSTAEIVGSEDKLLPTLLSDDSPLPIVSTWRRPDYFEFLAAGGYPAALARPTTNSRRRWFASYLGSVAERDLPQVADIRHPGALPRLYRLIAQQTSTVVGRTALGEHLGLAPATTRAYLDLLTHVYLVHELPGWTAGISAKAGRRPKIHVTDTGLAAAAIAADGHRLASGQLAGLFLESYVVTELMKQAILIDEPLTFAHFRDRSGVEVDIIIERPDGRVIAIEVKSATATNQADARGLRFLSDRLCDRLQAGLLLHTGPLTARLSEQIWASPVSAIWGGAAPVSAAVPNNETDRL